MKKLFAVFAMLLVGACLFAYSEKKEVTGVGVPEKVNHIEFWNGGSCIYKAENCSISIAVETNESLLSLTSKGNQVQFYVYKIRKDGIVISIVDSDSLAIIYW